MHDTGVAQGVFGDGFAMIATRRAVSAKKAHPFAHRTHRHVRVASSRASAALTQVTAGNSFGGAASEVSEVSCAVKPYSHRGGGGYCTASLAITPPYSFDPPLRSQELGE
eukprot:2898204-Prymnesium_polylepis.1